MLPRNFNFEAKFNWELLKIYRKKKIIENNT